MALRKIHTWPSEVLSVKASPVEEITEETQQLIDDMLETMYAAPGIGLAAPQVGVSQRVIVIDLSSGTEPDHVIALINPQVVASEGEMESEEGCLSLPDLTLKVRRAERIAVQGYNRQGEIVEVAGEELLAKALQHEIDHLDGVLLIDRVHPLRRQMLRKKMKKALASAE